MPNRRDQDPTHAQRSKPRRRSPGHQWYRADEPDEVLDPEEPGTRTPNDAERGRREPTIEQRRPKPGPG